MSSLKKLIENKYKNKKREKKMKDGAGSGDTVSLSAVLYLCMLLSTFLLKKIVKVWEEGRWHKRVNQFSVCIYLFYW